MFLTAGGCDEILVYSVGRWLQAEGCICKSLELRGTPENLKVLPPVPELPFWFAGLIAAPYEHKPVKKVALGQKDSVCQLALPVCAGRWVLARLLPIPTNGHRVRENGRLEIAKPTIRESVRPLSITGLTDRHTLPLYLLMGVKSAKVCACAEKFFASVAGCPVGAPPVGRTRPS